MFDFDPLLIQRLQQEALAGQPASRMLAMVQAELATRTEVVTSMCVRSYLHEAFGWSIKQGVALGAWHGFKDKAAAWTDEMIDARYAPLLQEWIQNPPPPRPSEAEEDAALSMSSGPISDADAEEAMKSLEMDWDDGVTKGKPKMSKRGVFILGAALALAMGGLVVLAASQDHNQRKSFDPVTGQWDGWFVAPHFFYPLCIWVALFALLGGFRSGQWDDTV